MLLIVFIDGKNNCILKKVEVQYYYENGCLINKVNFRSLGYLINSKCYAFQIIIQIDQKDL